MRFPRWIILAVCCLGMMSANYTPVAHANLVVVFGAELGFSKVGKGLFLGLQFGGAALGCLLAGPCADRWGFRLPLVLGVTAQVSGTLLLSCASTAFVAFASAMLAGCGLGLLGTVIAPLVVDLYPESPVRVLNLINPFSSIGALLALGLLTLLVAHQWPWRNVYRLLATLTAPYGAAYLLLPLPSKKATVSGPPLEFHRLVSRGPILMLLAAIFCSSLTVTGISMWLPTYAQEAAGSSRVGGVLGSLLLSSAFILGGFANFMLIGRVRLKRLALGDGILPTLVLLLQALPFPGRVLVVLLALSGLGLAGIGPAIQAQIREHFPEAGASAYSLLGLGSSAAAVLGPLAMGVIAQRMGVRAAVACLALGPCVAVLLLAHFMGQQEHSRRSGSDTHRV